MSSANLIDLSPPVGPGSPVWPGDVAYAQHTHWPMVDGSSVEVSHFTTTAHIGAHADAPAHFVRGGATIGEVSLDAYVGPCQVIDCRSGGRRQRVSLAEIQAALGTPGLLAPRLLIKTYATAVSGWDDHFPGLATDALTWLGEQGAVLIGVDGASLDPMESKGLAAHHAAYASGLAILENLFLADADDGLYELIALPLRLMIMDASPVRAVLRRPPERVSS